MTTAADKPGFTIKGWHVLAGLILFFGIIIGTDAAFMVLAYRTFSGQVASNPYEAGLAYNQTLERKKAQAALGWTATISDAGDRLQVVIIDAAGGPVDGLKVRATLERPATEAGRLSLALTPSGEGRYAAPLALAGAWDVRVVAEGRDGAHFEAGRRLVRR
jgi:nitrogen fixation protein FixH